MRNLLIAALTVVLLFAFVGCGSDSSSTYVPPAAAIVNANGVQVIVNTAGLSEEASNAVDYGMSFFDDPLFDPAVQTSTTTCGGTVTVGTL